MGTKNVKRILFFILIILNICHFSGDIFSEVKKKLFINDITPQEGISKEFAVKIRDEITLAIFENYSGQYQIVTDEDISVMYEKTSLMMAAGSDGQGAAVQVANAVNADEIIYGSVTKQGNTLRFTLQNLLRDSSSSTVSKKSFVTLDFPESQTEWYCREAAKKLINPDYKIDEKKAVSMIVPKFDIEDADIKSISGINIQKISFESNDQIASKIIQDLKPTVEEGDEEFNKGDYNDALDKYRDVIIIIGKKLRKDTQEKIEPFIKEILERIGAVHTVKIKEDIQEIDKYLQSRNPVTLDMLKKGRNAYEEILKPLLKLPSHEKEGMSKTFISIENRLTSIYITWVSIYETEGDTQYSQYQFRKAVAGYEEAVKIIDGSGVKNEKMSEMRDKLQKKKEIVLAAGASYLENKVVSYCNAAEYLNMKNNKWKARGYLDKAKQLIQNNKDFANERMADVYKDTAKIIQ